LELLFNSPFGARDREFEIGWHVQTCIQEC